MNALRCRQRHTGWGSALVRLAVVLLGAGSSACVTSATVVPSTPPVAQATLEAERAELEREIARFQRTWRSLWQSSLIDRGLVFPYLPRTQADYGFRIGSTETLRYEALLCNAGYLGEAGMAAAVATRNGASIRTDLSTPRPTATDRLAAASTGSLNPMDNPDPLAGGVFVPLEGSRNPLSLSSAQRIRGTLDKGQVCPRWTSSDGIPLDEGERLDLALPIGARTSAVLARTRLLARLDAGARRFPLDPWIRDQLVRFLLDNGEFDSALAALATCTIDDAACAELLGLLFSYRGELHDATSAFQRRDRLLAALPDAPCVDSLAFTLLPPADRRTALSLPCPEAAALETRLWWLADPLWSVSGNERYVSHHARRSSLRLRTALGEDERFSWRRESGADARREAIIRYGWPTFTFWGGWAMDSALSVARESVLMVPDAPYTTLEYAPDRTALIPTLSALQDPFAADASAWPETPRTMEAAERWWPTEHSARASPLVKLPAGQVAMFRRDSVVQVVIAVDDPVHDLAPDLPVQPRVVLIASAAPREFHTVAALDLQYDAPLRVSGSLAAQPTVLSLEVPARVPVEPDHRLRFGVRPPPALVAMRQEGDLALSDLAVVRTSDLDSARVAPLDVESVAMALAGDLSFSQEESITVFWESYGFVPSDSAEIVLRIARRAERTRAQQFGALLGRSDGTRDSVSIRWSEPEPGSNTREVPARLPTIGRSMTLNLRTIATGPYELSVEMTRVNGERARATRRIEVKAATETRR